MKKYITQDRLKQNNTADIFIFILEKGTTTRREIEWETGFSWGTVSSNVAFLIEKGYVVEEKSRKTGGAGRLTYELRPNGEKIVSIGLDVNRTAMSAEVVGLDLSVKQCFTEPFAAQNQSELLAQAEELCRRAIEWCGESYRVFSIGIAFQGSVNGREGFSLRFPQIQDWIPYNVKEHFSARFELPIYLGHDPKCMLLAELSRKKYSDCVLVRVDEGIGMAVAQDGRILDDTEKFELGHTVSVRKGLPCVCGKEGCLEAYASLRGITERLGVSVEALFQNPERYAEPLAEAASYLELALYNVCMLFRPQKLILTGRAMELAPFAAAVTDGIRVRGVTLKTDLAISAAFGAAAESMKSAIKRFDI
ncbi:MAG: ROK family protein [Ruminococcaceae bacterium]|nr:ROK family protein [Oscillospiraceae bacterium]